MEVFIHFIFELVKIALLSSFYAFILLMLIKLYGSFRPKSWLYNLTRKEAKFWRKSFVVIYLILFIWQFTYWGNHGLGDSARIPIGYGKDIRQINGLFTFIRPKGYETETFPVYAYSLNKNYCFGETDEDVSKNQYFIWNLETNEAENYETIQEFQTRALQLKIPINTKLSTFRKGYSNYWNEWRFWLLP